MAADGLSWVISRWIVRLDALMGSEAILLRNGFSFVSIILVIQMVHEHGMERKAQATGYRLHHPFLCRQEGMCY